MGSYASMFRTLYQTPLVHARIAMVYAPGQRDRTKLVPYVALSLLRGQSPKLASGLRRVDWVYVGDVVDGLLVAPEATGAIGHPVELESGVLTSVREVVEELARAARSDIPLLFGEVAERLMEREYAANVTQTSERVDWRPKIPLAEGLRRTVEWYAEPPSPA